jgi:hypothetical protein
MNTLADENLNFIVLVTDLIQLSAILPSPNATSVGPYKFHKSKSKGKVLPVL